jgi:hypothetical protein
MTAPDARLALKLGGWASVAIGVFHLVGLLFAWTFFRWTTIEPEMRELSAKNEALPYVLTALTAFAFVVAGLYALAAAGGFRRLPLLRVGLAAVAVGYLIRGIAGVPNGIADGGVRAVLEGHLREFVFATAATVLGLCYAYGAWAYRTR